ncbi:MAG: hypothetical protein V7K26_27795 [Nostoc sp.]|uniref:hypothetical protein n=1 Tax=Nostoc sp. TaxID=1180 RepID=UPI002FEEAFD6
MQPFESDYFVEAINYLYSSASAERLDKLMLRENPNFHVIQEIEAALRQYSFLRQSICILGESTLKKLLYK